MTPLNTGASPGAPVVRDMKKKLVISTGAGISKESGIPTFRDADGLWENYPVMEVCSATGFRRNPALVHEFYNARRRQLMECVPNAAHHALVDMEKDFDVRIITQNIDNLHERAGSSKILHLHGELMKLRAIEDPDYTETLTAGNLESTPATIGRNGMHMRPHIVFFEEPVPNMERAIGLVREADIFVVIGTSLVVYPAASLLHYVRPGVPVYYIDPAPASVSGPANVTVIAEPASEGVRTLARLLGPLK